MPTTTDDIFREAVSAIDAGDVPRLERLLASHRELVAERLTDPGEWLRSQIGPALNGFFKDPYLLWFVTEDAVRTGTMSANVAAIARAILDAARREGVRTSSSSSTRPCTSRSAHRSGAGTGVRLSCSTS